MTQLTLLRRGAELASPARQVELLEGPSSSPTFDECLVRHRLPALSRDKLEILQVNVGRLCNQTCRHCHVDAGPDRREIMSADTARACLRVLADGQIPVLDITGGAPEMNPSFRELVTTAREMKRRVIDRCNLTILTAPGYDDLPEFLAEQQVEIVASLPCYLEENTDRQRGDGVFARSIEALRRLNALGYGQPGSPLSLTLVYNPIGPSLPPSQATLEEAYRRELSSRYGVAFTSLFTIANLPIGRFLDDLVAEGRYEAYLEKLVNAFNPAAMSGVMCRNTLSVDWQGRLFDCDFNQMLDLPLASGGTSTIFDLAADDLEGQSIVTGRHCFGCTAGAGSSCQGAIL
jgi:radical SAM/Cys-rich protein